MFMRVRNVAKSNFSWMAGKSKIDANDFRAKAASAEEAEVEYFCTCDDRFLKKAKNISFLKLSVVTPLELVEELNI